VRGRNVNHYTISEDISCQKMLILDYVNFSQMWGFPKSEARHVTMTLVDDTIIHLVRVHYLVQYFSKGKHWLIGVSF
jgi:hypothetical protein